MGLQERQKALYQFTYDSSKRMVNHQLNVSLMRGAQSCTPQKSHAISRGNFFQPIFMVQPAENILGPDPGGCWQLMPLKFRSREWFPTENAWPQAGVWASVIVVGNPLPQDRSKMPLT